MPRRRTPPTLLAAVVIALAALAGCGDDEGSETPATTAASGATGATGAAGGTEEDATAKSDANAAATALESYATDNDGSYEGADANDVDQIEPVTSDVGVKTTKDTYEITAPSASGNAFTIERAADGTTTKTCTKAGVGGCPQNGEW